MENLKPDVSIIGMRLLAAALAWAGGAEARADWRDEIGYARLQALLGTDFAAGPAAGFTQAEAGTSSSEPVFEPDTANPNYVGKIFAHKSGTSGVSGHADQVATLFFGNATSTVSGNFPVDLYLADDWMGTALLKRGTRNQPGVESRLVENHSWIGTDEPAATVEEIGRRLDFAIDRDGFVCVVGVNNGSGTALPALLCQSYHTISVGLANGNHSAGFTTMDGAGRIKPDLVAPADYTSFSTPMVATSAGLLAAGLAEIQPAPGTADRPRLIKALLLASATRDTVAAWSNTPATPLDLRYGAGGLNVHHAFRALAAGRAAAGNVDSGNTGWGVETVPANGTTTFFFTIPDGPPTPFGAALTWHRQVTSSRVFFTLTWSQTMENLDLRLLHAEGHVPGELVAESLSAVDNVELVARPALAPGRYALEVKNAGGTATPFALAWSCLPAVAMDPATAAADELTGAPAEITIHRSGPSSIPQLVPIATEGNAVAGVDFAPLPGSIIIPAGQSSAVLEVFPLPDSIAQGDRSLTLRIGADFTLIRDPSAAVTVTLRDKPFDAWRFLHFPPAQLADDTVSSALADPDADQLANLLEYALATDPLAAGTAPVTAGVNGGFLTLHAAKNPAATDVVWSAEVSGNLADWQPAEVVTDTTDTFGARDPVPASPGQDRFIRLKITRP